MLKKPDHRIDDPSLLKPFSRVVPKLQDDETAPLKAPRPRIATAGRPKTRSVPPIVFLAGFALLLAAGIGAGALYLLGEDEQVADLDQAADEDLTAVEQLPIVLPEGPPAIIDLSGDPVVLPRRQHSLRQVSEVAVDTGVAATLKLAGPLYRMSDHLLSPEIQLVSGATASQQNFAFFQAEPGPEAQVQASSESAQEPDAPAAESEDATIYYVDGTSRMEGPGTRESVVSLVIEEAPAAMLERQGWSAEHARQVQETLAALYGIEALQAGDVVAVTGIRSSGQPPLYVPGRMVLYRDKSHAATLALTDRGEYVEGEDPWFGELPFEDTGEAQAPSRSVSLLDAIYGSALRNEVPTSIVGEAILTLSRAHDLSQAVKAGDRVTLLFTPEPRDNASGFGKVLYIRIDRESDGIECFVFQPGQGKSFTCVSPQGHARDQGDSMITPVSGVLSTKFGPRKDPATGKSVMHPGVAWAAPAGTAVVAAFAGTVESAGSHPDYGNYLKLAHSDGRVTAYGHLQRFAPHIEEGVEIEAGGLVGYVGKSGKTSEPQLFFQLLRNGQPTDPFGTLQRIIESGGAVEALVQRIIHVESAGNPNAKNPLSTATGLGQFIASTWLTMINTHRPDLAQGRTREEILALRTDPDIATEMVAALARGNASYLRSRGQPVTPGNLYLSHFLGPDGAVTALAASQDTPLANLFPAAVIKANPFLTGKTAGYVVEWAARKMQRKSKSAAVASAPEPPRNVFAGNAEFVALKQAIETLLN